MIDYVLLSLNIDQLMLWIKLRRLSVSFVVLAIVKPLDVEFESRHLFAQQFLE